MFTIRLLACVCALRTARGGGGPGALSFQDAVSGAVEAEKEAAEIGKFKEETIKVDMVPDEMGMNPEGKAPLGLAFNIYHTQAYMFNEVAHWGQIGMYVVAKLWLGAGGGKLYPILGKVPPRSTLVEETPGALVFRRVYVQQVEHLTDFAEYNSTRHFPILHYHDSLSDASDLWGTQNVALCYERPRLSDKAWLERARAFDLLLVGSTWSLTKLHEAGVPNARVLPPFVPLDVFHPGHARMKFDSGSPEEQAGLNTRMRGKFVVFSAGPLEADGGQDILVAAFKKFSTKHKDAFLLASWVNPAPMRSLQSSIIERLPGQGVSSVTDSGLLKSAPRVELQMTSNRGRVVGAGYYWDPWVEDVGLPKDRVFFMDYRESRHVQNDAFAARMISMADVAVFPHRVAARPDRYLMAAMAMGKPVIASNGTAHGEACTADSCFMFDAGGETAAKGEASDVAVEALLQQLEAVRKDPEAAELKGRFASERATAQFGPDKYVDGLVGLAQNAGIGVAGGTADASSLVQPPAWHTQPQLKADAPAWAYAAFCFGAVVALYALFDCARDRKQRAAHRKLLIATYTKHAPNKLADVDKVLDAYRHNYAQLVQRLDAVYGEKKDGGAQGKEEDKKER